MWTVAPNALHRASVRWEKTFQNENHPNGELLTVRYKTRSLEKPFLLSKVDYFITITTSIRTGVASGKRPARVRAENSFALAVFWGCGSISKITSNYHCCQMCFKQVQSTDGDGGSRQKRNPMTRWTWPMGSTAKYPLKRLKFIPESKLRRQYPYNYLASVDLCPLFSPDTVHHCGDA